MKKLYLSILSIAAFTGINAQTITSSNIPVPGDNFSYYKVVPSSVGSLGSAGTGQTYSFSTISVGTTMGVKSYVTSASTPNGSSFTTSTVAEKDTIGGTNYAYYTGTSSSHQLDGLTIDINVMGTPVTATVTLSDAGVLFNSFPFSYGSTNGTDQLSGACQTSFGNGTVSGDITTEVDGSGSLVILGNTFSNVIRLKIVTNITATLSLGSISQTETRYQYYSSADKFPLFEHTIRDVSGAQDTTVLVNATALVGMQENATIAFNLFPNPAASELNIQFNQAAANNASIEIINGLGQIVKTETVSGLSKKIELAGLSAGFYYVRVTNGKASRVEKLIIE